MLLSPLDWTRLPHLWRYHRLGSRIARQHRRRGNGESGRGPVARHDGIGDSLDVDVSGSRSLVRRLACAETIAVRLRCLVGSSRARLAATMVPRLETHQLVNGI